MSNKIIYRIRAFFACPYVKHDLLASSALLVGVLLIVESVKHLGGAGAFLFGALAGVQFMIFKIATASHERLRCADLFHFASYPEICGHLNNTLFRR